MTDESIRIRRDVDAGRDVIYFPKASYKYSDIQGGAVEIGLGQEWMKTLYSMLREWIRVTSYIENARSVQFTKDECSHEDTGFDRSICPEPCEMMHNYCCACSKRMEDCPVQDFLYDGQNKNETCVCGHAAMVHTSGSGNCLAFGESSQEDSHCLEFMPPRTAKPVTVCSECGHSDPHDAVGIGVCRADDCGCDGPPGPCTDCGHATVHGVGTPGVFPQYCEIEGCDCTGRETPCHECPHSWWQHQQGDGGCPHCDCRAGEKVKPPVRDLCDECFGEVYTFPKAVVALGQRLENPDDMWATFFYTDAEGDRLEISDGYTDDGVLGVNLFTTGDGVFVPLDTLEAVISAIRESGYRAIKGSEQSS